MKKIFSVFLVSLLLFSCDRSAKTRILVFSKTTGFRHESIGAGKKAIMELGDKNGILVDTTEDASFFTESELKKYAAVVFLNCTGDLFTDEQKSELKRYIQAGGGFVGIHGAADAEHNWDYYQKLVGAEFLGHPAIQEAKLDVLDHTHLSTKGLPKVWKRKDEWYNFKNIYSKIKVLINIDEQSYNGGTNGENHPMAWVHHFDGGRSFYTALGHTNESYSEPLFLDHLWGGLQFAIGEGSIDYTKASPEEDRFVKTVLAEKLSEPMKLAVSSEGELFFVQRTGEILKYDPIKKSIVKMGELAVFEGNEDGLMGIALDPNFTINRWVYLYYSPLQGVPRQHLSRFQLTSDRLDMSTEKVVLTVPTQRQSCCHSAGDLAFDAEGNLLIAVGDNTVASEYAAIDERPGRSNFDAQKSASNTNDLRGKILRIHPEPDGSYTIPAGNLFPRDGSAGKPEIYAMGLRNPFNMTIDPKTSWVYWGEVGPDAGEDSELGPKGHDEFNVAKKPGFFGWPYFVGNNKPYTDVDFATNKTNGLFDPSHPKNNSPNNTGSVNLPAAQGALIWYPAVASEEFPEVGKGSRSAMAGPFFYLENYKNAPGKFPAYFEGKLFLFEWMRNWIMAVEFDKNGKIKKLERIFENMSFDHPIDMAFAADGSLYLLEYGTRWYSANDNARLVHITFDADNRPPVAVIEAQDTMGALPLKVKFNGSKSFDPDADKQKFIYEWRFEGNRIQSREVAPTFTYTKAGIYTPSLTVTDDHGKSTTAKLTVIAGNHIPEVKWQISSNRSFFWPGIPIEYSVTVKDVEDKNINPSDIKIFAKYASGGGKNNLEEAPKKQEIDSPVILESDCKACHTIDERSVGPAFREVAKRYKNDKNAVDKLAQKIIKGGSGAWGEHPMTAHPQVSMTTAKEMVQYILSLEKRTTGQDKLLPKGQYMPEAKTDLNAHYYFTASYQDKGSKGALPLTAKVQHEFRSPFKEAGSFDMHDGTVRIQSKDQSYYYEGLGNKLSLGYKNIDLAGLKEIIFTANSKEAVGRIEIRIDSLEGKVIGFATVKPTGSWEDWREYAATINSKGVHDLYFVFKTRTPEDNNWINMRYIYFKNVREK